jgi:hypothetical protein
MINKKEITQKHVEDFYNRILIVDEGPNKGCWTFNAANDRDGYPYYNFNKKTTRAHRFSYIISNYDKEEKINIIRHTCNNPWCVNPNHLVNGSQQENINDKIKDNRQAKGSKTGTSKITEEQLISVLDKILSGEITKTKQIVTILNISHTNIIDILHGKIWTHVTNNYNLNEIRNKVIQKILTIDEVKDIKKRLLNNQSQRSIAKKYSVDPKTIYAIKNNQSFQNVKI